jgi:hypothetical protein
MGLSIVFSRICTMDKYYQDYSIQANVSITSLNNDGG